MQELLQIKLSCKSTIFQLKKKSEQSQQKTNNAVADLSPDTSIIIWNISSLNSAIKKTKIAIEYKEIWLNYMPLKRNSLLI